MGFFSERVKGETNAFALAQRCMQPYFDTHPAVCEALCGSVDDKGVYVVAPMSIALSVENGGLMFRISSKLSQEAFFGQVRDASQIFDSIEVALAKGEYKAIENKYRETGLKY